MVKINICMDVYAGVHFDSDGKTIFLWFCYNYEPQGRKSLYHRNKIDQKLRPASYSYM